MIGDTHRVALRFDDAYEVVAAVLSSDPRRSLKAGQLFGIPRPYGTIEEMLRSESLRPDGCDVVAIMTPNDSHFPICLLVLEAGFHVICDKPITNNLSEALDLLRCSKKNNRRVCITYNYSGYPMIRQARSMISAGEIGRPHLVEVRYAQGNLGTLVESDSDSLSPQLRWRLDPKRGGETGVLLDVGTHAFHLTEYVTSLDFISVFADIGAAVAGRTIPDSATILARLRGGVRTVIQASKAATGAPNIFDISVFGSLGGLAWRQSEPNTLRIYRQEQPIQELHRGVKNLSDLAKRSLRSPTPHPEGFREAFANIYSDFASVIATDLAGRAPDEHCLTFPSISDGVRGLATVEACRMSAHECRWIDVQSLEDMA